MSPTGYAYAFWYGSISPLQKYQAIRNRGYTNQAIRNHGYTNQVRLRGLKEFETQVGGFCLYSRLRPWRTGGIIPFARARCVFTLIEMLVYLCRQRHTIRKV
ncbi:MAG: hypothetical protein V7K86_10015 [Nostoc sp.]|uniref:hypothetical protein n=1 Tax=Nostoc sp. TaxID=1180 RepID=UPI002FFD4B62